MALMVCLSPCLQLTSLKQYFFDAVLTCGQIQRHICMQEEEGMEPDKHIYTAFINACAQGRRPQQAHALVRLSSLTN